MAGHSKWSNIKHRKGAQDAKRGKVFTKIIKEVTVAAKLGGGDPDSNPRLRAAIQNAKSVNMPKDNIEKAIKKATGADGTVLEEINYEGYGPFGVAIFVECATDNNTRTVSNVRSYFNKHGGSLGKDGCLQFVFDRKAMFSIDTTTLNNFDEEEFTLELIDVGAEDVELDNSIATVSGNMKDFGSIQKKLEEMNIETQSAKLERVPLTLKEISKEEYEKLQKLIDVIEDDDDVQQVFHNIQFEESWFS